MATRSARTAWTGTLMEGTGEVALTSSGAGTFAVTFPKRISDAADGTTPEELIAAAHSSCFAMQMSGLLAKAGGTPQSLDITADVTVEPDTANGGLHITDILLTVRGKVEGLSAEEFVKVAEDAKVSCPVSKALAVDMRLDAALDS